MCARISTTRESSKELKPSALAFTIPYRPFLVTYSWPRIFAALEGSMPFEWKAFVDLARGLGEQSTSAANPEACLRTALSRAYFGAYGQARRYAAPSFSNSSRVKVSRTTA